MKLEEIQDYQIKEVLSSDIKHRMEHLSSQYPFTLDNQKKFIPLDGMDYLDYGFPHEHRTVRLREHPKGLFIDAFDGKRSLGTVKMDEVFQQRRLNLIDEARTYPSADPPYNPTIQYIVADCGVGGDLRQIMALAQQYGFKKCWGARPSCGVQDVFQRYYIDDIDVSTIGFETGELGEKGDRIEVLYVGTGTTDIDFIHHVVGKLINDFEFTMLTPEDA